MLQGAYAPRSPGTRFRAAFCYHRLPTHPLSRRRPPMLTRLLLAFAASALLAAPALAADPNFTRKEDVIYGRKYGLAMTMDVFTPKEKPNGAGVIWCVSGGWFSAKESVSSGYA